MRLLLPALALAAALLPAAAISTALYAAPGRAPAALAAPGSTVSGVEPVKAYPNNLLVVSAGAGLRLSRDGGATWATPRGLPPRGSVSAVAADPNPTHSGVAYATNGAIYQTRDGGQSWRQLPAPPDALGPAGATALACDSDGTLYAAGATVLVYRGGARWEPVGRGWSEDTHVSLLLATPATGLYAVAGARLLNLTGATARWTLIHAWPGAITALTLGPDGTTPYAAVQGRGIWRVDAGVHHLGGDGLPDTTPVYALRSDPVGNDLYVGTDNGLLKRHRPVDPSSLLWYQALNAPADPIVALAPLRGGESMLALSSRRALLYHGVRANGQILVWTGVPRSPHQLPVAPPLIAALSGGEWRPPRSSPRLPAAFAHSASCAFRGPTIGQSFDVCGPFDLFYFQYPGQSLFGFPLGLARATTRGDVEQDFEKARFSWTRGGGVRLFPLNRPLAAQRHFAHPTPAQSRQFIASNSVCPDGYCVDPRFYQFWRSYQSNGVSIFGLPLSQVFTEQSSDGSGSPVPVQYFANARLEDHRGVITVSFLNGVPR